MRMEKAVVLKWRNGRRVKMLKGHAISEKYFLHEHQPYKHVIQQRKILNTPIYI